MKIGLRPDRRSPAARRGSPAASGGGDPVGGPRPSAGSGRRLRGRRAAGWDRSVARPVRAGPAAIGADRPGFGTGADAGFNREGRELAAPPPPRQPARHGTVSRMPLDHGGIDHMSTVPSTASAISRRAPLTCLIWRLRARWHRPSAALRRRHALQQALAVRAAKLFDPPEIGDAALDRFEISPAARRRHRSAAASVAMRSSRSAIQHDRVLGQLHPFELLDRPGQRLRLAARSRSVEAVARWSASRCGPPARKDLRWRGPGGSVHFRRPAAFSLRRLGQRLVGGDIGDDAQRQCADGALVAPAPPDRPWRRSHRPYATYRPASSKLSRLSTGLRFSSASRTSLEPVEPAMAPIDAALAVCLDRCASTLTSISSDSTRGAGSAS